MAHAYLHKNTLIRSLLISMVGMILFSVGLLGVIWIIDAYRHCEAQCRDLREKLISSKKELIRHEVEGAVKYIKHKQMKSKIRLQQSIRDRVYDAHAMKDDADKCTQAGCDDCLAKPVMVEKLIAILAKYLEPTEK